MPKLVRGRYKRKKKLKAKIEENGLSVDHLSQEYGFAYLREKVVPLVESQPAKGLLVAQETAQKFREYKAGNTRLPVEVRKLANCLANSCDGLEAEALRCLGRARESTMILSRITECCECLPCVAEGQRIVSMSYLALGKTAEAKAAIQAAMAAYRKLGSVGHNLSGQPSASCLIYSAHIDHFSGNNREAIQHARSALVALVPTCEENKALYYASTINLSTYLFWEAEFGEAEVLLEKAAQHYYSEPELTVGQVITTWFRGMLRARKIILGLSADWRRRGRPERLLELARSQANSLGMVREAIMIEADLLAYYVLLARSFWLAETALTQHIVKDIPTAAVEAYAEVHAAIRAQDTGALWSALRKLRQYDPKNEIAVPFILPELKLP